MREKALVQSIRKKLKLFCLCMTIFCIAMSMCSMEAAAKQKSKDTLKINKTAYTMKKGTSFKLKVTKSKSAKKKKVIWTSSNKKVALVSSSGKVTAKKNGKTTVTAKLDKTKTKVTCKIVVGTPVKSVKLNRKSLGLKTGEKFSLKATVSPKKSSNKKVSYKSSKPSVAKVSAKGVVTALKPGTAKITATAKDGTGKSANCSVTVGSNVVVVSKVTLSDAALSLAPGQTKKLSAAVQPSNATNKTLTWSSSDTKVATVAGDGTIKAVGEGSAVVKVTANNGVSASCSVKSAYPSQAGNQKELENALSSKMNTHVVYSSDSADKITIPARDYSNKTLEINAPNAEVDNSGQFKKVVINAIAENTYKEHANNIIDFRAAKGRVVIGENAAATINLGGSAGQAFCLENNGSVNDLHVSGKAVLRLEGKQVIPVTLADGAGETSITTSAELRITASVRWDMTMLPGAEHSKAAVEDMSCIPSVEGVGYLPVTVNGEEGKDIINIYAEISDSPEITQTVDVSGHINEYYLSEEEESVKKAVNRNSEGAEVDVVPYTKDNSLMDENNCGNYLENSAASVKTDSDGNFSVSGIKVGNYWLIIQKEGYKPLVKSVIITSNNADTYSCGTVHLISDEIAGCGIATEVSGTIIDSLTGSSANVAGIQVKLRAGAGNIIGTVLQSAETDENGRYVFKDVAPGIYTVEAMDLRTGLAAGAIRYNASNMDIIVAEGYLASDGYNCTLDQQMQDTLTGKGQVQFRLNWGSEDSGASADIDSHLVGPKADGNGVFHVYYVDMDYYATDSSGEEVKMADLDVDDTHYDGPEHTTIYKETNGIYRFYVHNFSESGVEGSDMLSKSSVRVTITIGDNFETHYCPNQKGNLWYVCDYNSMTHTVTMKNEMSDFLLDERYIGLSEEELEQLQKEQILSDAASVKRDLEMKFSDNAKKTELLNRIAELEGKIQAESDFAAVQKLNEALEEIRGMMENSSFNFSFGADNEILDYEWNTDYIYNDDDEVEEIRQELICSVAVGSELKNFRVDESEDYIAQVKASDVEGYVYAVHVTDRDTGLERDVYVRVLADQLASRILTDVQQCRKTMAVFEENESIREDQQKLNGILDRAEAASSDEEYTQLREELQAIQEKYEGISSQFSINTLDSAAGLKDWWEIVRTDRDEDGAWTDSYAVLRIERSEDITDEDVLSKLTPGFENEDMAYEIVDSNRDGYSKLIRITDGEYTKNVYISISVW